MKGDTVKPEEHAPSTKAKDKITRISNLLVESAIIYETLRLERLGIGIDSLVMGHAPINVFSVGAYVEDARKLTIN